jgi:hypothetical protein
MGLTHVAVRLFNSNSQDIYEANFLVDTGATDTMAPAFELKTSQRGACRIRAWQCRIDVHG